MTDRADVGRRFDLQSRTVRSDIFYRMWVYKIRVEKISVHKIYLYRLVATVLLGCSGSVCAQFAPPAGGCPPGMHLEGFSCVYDRQPAAAVNSAPPAQQWATRWGAIAIGSTAAGGGFGASAKMKSKRKAEAAAVKACKNTGGGAACKAAFAYYDQCAVVAWGTRNFTIQGAESIEIASDLAIRDCSAKTEDCQVFYSGCSYPERIQ